MTNREMLISALKNEDIADDGGSHDESVIYYNVRCPYIYINSKALCIGKAELIADYDTCVRCKNQWLDEEVSE